MKRLLFLVLLVAPFVWTDAALAEQQQLAAVMRQDSAGSGWYLLDTTAHTPQHILDVTEESDGKLRVWYSQRMAEVNGVNVTPDVSFSAARLTVGASVGRDYTDISLFAPFVLQLTGTTVTWGQYLTTNGTPPRVGIDTSMALVDGTIKVTHAGVDYPGGIGTPIQISQIGGPPQVWVASQTKNSYILQATPAFWASGAKVAIQRGIIRVRAQDVFSASGNLWFTGVCETVPTVAP
jgi:hypothetical protein